MALESISTCTENILKMSIVLRAIERYKKILQILSILIVGYKGNFSHQDCLVVAIGMAKSKQTEVILQYVRRATVLRVIFFYLKYSKSIYQQLRHTNFQLLYTKSQLSIILLIRSQSSDSNYCIISMLDICILCSLDFHSSNIFLQEQNRISKQCLCS